ncbi:MAG: hypothetical protein IID44_03400 [Planctomycetes bacterium]|nr:hypothetical protein [Planctomycetota bacterium]
MLRSLLMRMVVVVLAITGSHVFGQGGRSLPGNLGFASSRENAGQIDWTLSMVQSWTTYDSIYVESTLTNNSPHEITFKIRDAATRPKLILRSKGQPTAKKVVDLQGTAQTFSTRRHAVPGQQFCKFSLDLRKYFGKFKPGTYTLQIVWPAKGFAIGNLPSYRPTKFVSGKIEFDVVATSLEKIIKNWGNPSRGAYLLLEIEESLDCDAKSKTRKGKLTNIGKRDLFVPYHYRLDENRTPITKIPLQIATTEWTKFYPDGNYWLHYRQKTAPGKRYLYRLAPGKSVQLSLPDLFQGLDGIYSYSVTTVATSTVPQYPGKILQKGDLFYTEDLTKLMRNGAASKWFVVDRVRPVEEPR